MNLVCLAGCAEILLRVEFSAIRSNFPQSGSLEFSSPKVVRARCVVRSEQLESFIQIESFIEFPRAALAANSFTASVIRSLQICWGRDQRLRLPSNDLAGLARVHMSDA